MIELLPITTLPTKHAVVLIADGDFGPHVGISYRTNKVQRLLHLAFHFKLVDEPLKNTKLKTPLLVVPDPDIDEEELKLLASFCALRARRAQDIPYGFPYVAGTFASGTGAYLPGRGELGLTCSTFVLAMFEWAQIDLIVRSTWKARASDDGFHKKIIELLEEKKASTDHVAALRKNVRCVRIRAEEVAASTATAGRPLSFVDAEAAGEDLARQFYERTGS